MARWWTVFVASLADVSPGGITGLALAVLLAAGLAAVLWYTWPPTIFARLFGRGGGGGRGGRQRGRLRLPRLRWPRWRIRLGWLLFWRRRRRTPADVLDGLAPDELPDIPAGVLALTADDLAAAGRYAEAVRERLRAIVRDLVERGVIEHRPGWTVTELARAAGHAQPRTAPPLHGAAGVFSEIWYGQRPATVDDDVRMRGYAAAVRGELVAT